MRSFLPRKLPEQREWLYWNFERYTSDHPSLVMARRVGEYQDRKILAALEENGRRVVVMAFDNKRVVWLWHNGRWAGVNQLENNLSVPMAEFYAKEQMEQWVAAEQKLTPEQFALIA
ncbi:hypothetical protein IC617_08950 [Neiella sp. HB171785]|uniref:Uncharacterized protein n=1 Tax=Neiella litorisoli TaxID=2771431 RepID=A0A8J6QH92_9GAMM|nr:hypothetical protein [Neiella litorisoli]MBD1389555.1 hypothetical protein [Neiella litorisoli]